MQKKLRTLVLMFSILGIGMEALYAPPTPPSSSLELETGRAGSNGLATRFVAMNTTDDQPPVKCCELRTSYTRARLIAYTVLASLVMSAATGLVTQQLTANYANALLSDRDSTIRTCNAKVVELRNCSNTNNGYLGKIIDAFSCVTTIQNPYCLIQASDITRINNEYGMAPQNNLTIYDPLCQTP